MKVSICMPVLGRARMFFEALCSILCQGDVDFELVVQDGDPAHPVRDDPRVAQALALLGGDKVSYEAKKDAGIFHAVNAALRRATGDILYFMCSDDLLCPGALAGVSVAFEAERFGGPFWLYGQTVSADATGKTLGIDGRPTTLTQMLQHNRLGQPAVFWNRQMLDRVGPFDVRYRHAADYDLWLRMWRQREPLFLAQTLGVFRRHGGNASQVNAAMLEQEATKISWRHFSIHDIIEKACNILKVRKIYGASGAPESHN